MTRNPRNPFAETGAASSVIALQEDLGLDFVGDSQLDITPFQRQMFEAEKAREAEAKEEKMEEARGGGGGGGRQMNSMNGQSPPGGSSELSQSETVRYINEDEGEDGGGGDTLSVID